MGHLVMEDRGFAHYIFAEGGGNETFDSGDGTLPLLAVVSAPIGWKFQPDPTWGVVLKNVFGKTKTAAQAWAAAVHGIDGFRVREDHRYLRDGD